MAGEDHNATTRDWLALISTVSSIAAPISVVSALLVFAAWTQTKAYFEYFGVDPRVLGLTAQDYLFRSANAAFGVLSAVAACGIGALAVLRLVACLEGKIPDRKRGVARLVAAWSAVSSILGGLLWAFLPLAEALKPYADGALLLGASLVLFYAKRYLGFAKRSFADYLTRAVLAGVVVAAGFWVTTEYAADLGMQEAAYVDAHPGEQAEVDVFSGQPLDIPGDLVAPSSPSLTPSKITYRYVGLRLLEYSNNRWLLLTGHRSGMRTSVLILRDNDDIHVEITQPPQ